MFYSRESFAIFSLATNQPIINRECQKKWGIFSSKPSQVPLNDRLNPFPIGLVDSEKLREILSSLFTEDEAFIASKFPLEEVTIDELSGATDIEPGLLLPNLESMADNGLVMDMPYSGITY